MSYVIEQTFLHKKLTLIYSPQNVFDNRFLKPVDGCIMGWALDVTFSVIHIIKMESGIVLPSKPIFFWRFIDEINSRRKIWEKFIIQTLKLQ